MARKYTVMIVYLRLRLKGFFVVLERKVGERPCRTPNLRHSLNVLLYQTYFLKKL